MRIKEKDDFMGILPVGKLILHLKTILPEIRDKNVRLQLKSLVALYRRILKRYPTAVLAFKSLENENRKLREEFKGLIKKGKKLKVLK